MNSEKLLDDISQFVSDSRALLKQGAIMELAGLENRVALLCKEVISLPKDDRARYSERVQQLMEDLTALGDEMAVQRDMVADELRNTASRKKAHTAYRVAEKRDKKDE